MPTGVHLPNARELLFDAAERVLLLEGVSGLTSRAVTAEAGVAKGVMHRHFADFDAFMAELVLDRAAGLVGLDGPMAALLEAAGKGSVAGNLVEALEAVFSPLGVAVPALVITRDGLRAQLRQAGASRFPLIAEGLAAITAYLEAEQALGRAPEAADAATLAHTLIGATHLLFTDRESGPPDTQAVRSVVVGVLQAGRPRSAS
ncbi:MAG TPA: TetR family transcriptional regulator [Acidimicrobiales bacterium]|nr:TetR family transcriptional regulator [Acidimicrobiales bacterium]